MMLEELKGRIEDEGYFAYLDSEYQNLYISAKTGMLRRGTQESTTSYIASIFYEDGKFTIAETRVPRSKRWQVDSMQDVIDYLLNHRPNIPLGEENTWT